MTLIKTGAPADTEQRATSGMERDIRDCVRRNVATLRRAPDNESELVVNDLSAMLQRVAGSSTGSVLI
jgi:hypothetical protein